MPGFRARHLTRHSSKIDSVANQDPKRHHYIPCFYTKRWTGSDGLLCEYSKPHRDVIDRRKHSSAVGWAKNLYTIEGEDGKLDTSLESGFFAPVDQAADRAIDWLINRRGEQMPFALRQAFTALLLSFLHRTPDRVEQITSDLLEMVEKHFSTTDQNYPDANQLGLPQGVSHAEAKDRVRSLAAKSGWAKVLKSAIGSEFIGNHITNMQWHLRRVLHSNQNLLTGDKPLMYYNGIGRSQGNIALPISPEFLFVATNNLSTASNILNVSDNFLARRVNHEICSRAQKYIYGTSAAHLSFVEARLGLPERPRELPRGTPPAQSQWRIN